ncbi:MAG: hypothetical protein IKX59_02020 [Bacteroidales bacterium]|nr:hypothetical protein [Bacteroidales bacterium]
MVNELKSYIEIVDRKYGTWIFYVALVLMLTSLTWFWLEDIPYDIKVLSNRFLKLGQVLCCLRLALLSWKYPKYVILCAAIISLFYYSYLLSYEIMLLKTAMLVAASRDADIKVILRIYLVIFLTMMFLGPMTLLLDWTGDIVKHKYNHVGHSYGFYNPNRYAYLMQMLILLVILILHIRQTLWLTIICWAAALVVGWMTLSTTSVIVLFLFPLVYYWLKHHTIPLLWLALLPCILTVISIGLSFYFGPSTGDTTFESRFSIPYLLFERHGLSWLGQDCGIVTWKKAFREGIEPLYINNLYLTLFVINGVIVAFLMLALYGLYLYRIGRLRNPLLLSMAICLALSGLMQLFPLNIMLDFLLLYFFQEPFVRKNVVKVENE